MTSKNKRLSLLLLLLVSSNSQADNVSIKTGSTTTAIPIEVLQAVVKAATEGAVSAASASNAVAMQPKQEQPPALTVKPAEQVAAEAPLQPQQPQAQAQQEVKKEPEWLVQRSFKHTLEDWSKNNNLDLIWPENMPDHHFSAKIRIPESDDLFGAVSALVNMPGLAVYSVKMYDNAIVVSFND